MSATRQKYASERTETIRLIRKKTQELSAQLGLRILLGSKIAELVALSERLTILDEITETVEIDSENAAKLLPQISIGQGQPATARGMRVAAFAQDQGHVGNLSQMPPPAPAPQPHEVPAANSMMPYQLSHQRTYSIGRCVEIPGLSAPARRHQNDTAREDGTGGTNHMTVQGNNNHYGNNNRWSNKNISTISNEDQNSRAQRTPANTDPHPSLASESRDSGNIRCSVIEMPDEGEYLDLFSVSENSSEKRWDSKFRYLGIV